VLVSSWSTSNLGGKFYKVPNSMLSSWTSSNETLVWPWRRRTERRGKEGRKIGCLWEMIPVKWACWSCCNSNINTGSSTRKRLLFSGSRVWNNRTRKSTTAGYWKLRQIKRWLWFTKILGSKISDKRPGCATKFRAKQTCELEETKRRMKRKLGTQYWPCLKF